MSTKTPPRRTRSAKSTATEFAHACAAGRVHDADLCDRVRELEQKVADLESSRPYHHCGYGCPYHYYPQWTWTSTGTNLIKTYTGTTTGDIKTGKITTYGN